MNDRYWLGQKFALKIKNELKIKNSKNHIFLL